MHCHDYCILKNSHVLHYSLYKLVVLCYVLFVLLLVRLLELVFFYIFQITGLAVLALGIAWFFKDRILSVSGWTSDTIKSLLNNTGGTIELSQVLQIAAIVFLVVGSVIIVTAIMACVATATKNSVMFALVCIYTYK